MPYDSPLLDALRPASTSWTFAVDDTVSIREAKKRIHCQYLSAMKTLDVQVAEAQRKNLRDYAKKSAFLDRCKAARRTRKSLWDHLDLDLEDDVPQTVQGLTDTAFDARIEPVYIKTVDQAAIALQKKAQLESLQQKRKERQIQELLKSKPEDLLNAVIDERISDRLKPRRRNQRGPAVDIAGIFTESQGLKPAERVHCEPHVSDAHSRTPVEHLQRLRSRTVRRQACSNLVLQKVHTKAKARVLQENLRPRAKTKAKVANPLDRRAKALVMEEFFHMPKEPARRKEKAKETNLALHTKITKEQRGKRRDEAEGATRCSPAALPLPHEGHDSS